jgi:hypothetical protein
MVQTEGNLARTQYIKSILAHTQYRINHYPP